MAEAALFDTFARAPLRFVRGEGVWLVTETGERYLDFGAGVAVTSCGHSNPHLVETLRRRQRRSGTCPTSTKFLIRNVWHAV